MPQPTEEERRLKRLFFKAKESVRSLESLVAGLPEGSARTEAERELANLSEFIKGMEG